MAKMKAWRAAPKRVPGVSVPLTRRQALHFKRYTAGVPRLVEGLILRSWFNVLDFTPVRSWKEQAVQQRRWAQEGAVL